MAAEAPRERVADLEREEAELVDLLDLLPFGVILVDSDGGLLRTNRQARAVLSEANGLREVDGRLRATSGSQSHALRRLVSEAAAGELPRGGALALRRASWRRPLRVLVRPVVGPEAGPQRGTAVILLSDPERRALELEQADVMALYGLTAGEARVAIKLAYGLSPHEIAEQGAVGENTIRWHLKNIFAKIGVHSQASLVAVLLSGPILGA